MLNMILWLNMILHFHWGIEKLRPKDIKELFSRDQFDMLRLYLGLAGQWNQQKKEDNHMLNKIKVARKLGIVLHLSLWIRHSFLGC